MEIMLAKVGHLPEEPSPPDIVGTDDAGGFDGAAFAAPVNSLPTGLEPTGLTPMPEFGPIGGMFDTGQSLNWVSVNHDGATVSS